MLYEFAICSCSGSVNSGFENVCNGYSLKGAPITHEAQLFSLASWHDCSGWAATIGANNKPNSTQQWKRYIPLACTPQKRVVMPFVLIRGAAWRRAVVGSGSESGYCRREGIGRRRKRNACCGIRYIPDSDFLDSIRMAHQWGR